MNTDTKREMAAFRVRDEDHIMMNFVEQAAKFEHRSIADMLRTLVRRGLKASGWGVSQTEDRQ